MRLVVAFALAACSKQEAPSGPPPEAPLRGGHAIRAAIESGRLAGPGLAITAKPLAAPTAPGPAYLAVKHMAGIVKLDQGKATRISLPISYATALAVDGEQLYLADGKQLYKLTGETVEKLGTPAPEHLGTLAIAPDHTIWGRSLRAIYRFDKGGWITADVKVELPQELGFDGAGHVFTYGKNGLFVLDGSWKPMIDLAPISAEAQLDAPGLTMPAISASGELWIASLDYLLRIAKGKATFTWLDGGVASGRFLGDRYVAVGWPKPGLRRLSLDGKPESFTASTFEHGERVIDGRGRLWSHYPSAGLEVIADDGKVTKFAPGSIAEINGDIIELAIVGTGPDVLPVAGSEAARGTIRGKVVTGKVPVAGANVELCGDPAYTFKKSPCEGKPDRVTGKTGKDGGFEIEAVLRSYRVAIEVGNQWFTPPLWQKGCADLAPGEVCFMGELDTARAH